MILLPRAIRGRLRRARRWTRVAGQLAPYLAERRRSLAGALALSLGYTLMRLAEPWPMKFIIDEVLLGNEDGLVRRSPGRGEAGALYGLVAAIVGLALLRGLFYYRHRLRVARLGIEVTSDLRFDLYRHLQGLSLSFHDRRRTGDLIVRLTSDIRMLRAAFVSLPLELTEGVLLMTGMAVVMLLMDWQLALLALVMLPLVAVSVRRYRRPMRQAIRRQREREGHLATMAAESLGAIRVVKGFRGEKTELARFRGANRKDVRSGLKASRFEAKLKWSAEVSIAVITAVIVLLASRRILAGALSVGDMVVFLSYLAVYARPLRRVSKITERMIRASAAGERVLRILGTRSQVDDRPGAVKAPPFEGAISFSGVSFSYDGRRPVLEDVSLDIAPGERIAIVGATGAGKSTLASLVPRFYDPSAGSVSIDGHDIRGLTLDSLRRQVAVVFQEPVLFATSIAENISYGRPKATREQIERAARRARVDRIIERLPDGYDTVVGERGGTLSGGQRQCIAIARAMIRNAPIVILDELTAGLDPRSAELVTRALRRLMRGRTVLMITHDYRRLEGADRVVVLDRGRIARIAPPDDPGFAPLPALAAVGSHGSGR